jgi:hypothetical protein
LRFAVAACHTLAAAGLNGQPLPSKYDLIANVVHEGKAGQQTGGAPYKVHIQRSVEKTWYEVQVRGQTVVKRWFIVLSPWFRASTVAESVQCGEDVI